MGTHWITLYSSVYDIVDSQLLNWTKLGFVLMLVFMKGNITTNPIGIKRTI